MEKLLILDCGGHCAEKTAEIVREAAVFCEIKPFGLSSDEIKTTGYKGIIITGNRAFGDRDVDKALFELGIPVLGVGTGADVMTAALGGKCETADDNGTLALSLDNTSPLFFGVAPHIMGNIEGDSKIVRIPLGFRISAKSERCPIAAMENSRHRLYAMQFHPESADTFSGADMLNNFLFRVCGFKADWIVKDYAGKVLNGLKERLGNKSVLCIVDGSIRSQVAALIAHHAAETQVTCIMINHGLYRKDEAESIIGLFKTFSDLDFRVLDIKDDVLAALKGVTDESEKRAAVCDTVQTLLDKTLEELGHVDVFLSDRIYCDSVNNQRIIKTDKVNCDSIVEPLNVLFQDEVNTVGLTLNMPLEMVERPALFDWGLALRIKGEVNAETVEVLKECDAVISDTCSSDTERLECILYPQLPFAAEGYTLTVAASPSSDVTAGVAARRIAETVPKVGNVFIDTTYRKQ